MKINNKIHYAAYLVTLALLSYLFIKQSKVQKIAIVNTQKVLESYEGFKEAQDLYETKTNEMSQTFEKQKLAYESKSNEFKILSNKLSKEEIATKEMELKTLQAKTYQLGKAIEDQAAENEEKLIQGVYNKINDFIKRYGKKNNLDIITGITMSGNVLFASDAVNITDEIIENLNREYVEGVKE